MSALSVCFVVEHGFCIFHLATAEDTSEGVTKSNSDGATYSRTRIAFVSGEWFL